MRKVWLLVFLSLLSPLVLAQQGHHQEQNSPQAAPPAVNITPASLDFGNQVAGRASKPKRLTVTNTGGKALYINSVVLGGDNQQDFALSQDTCTGATIGPQKSYVVDIIFTPYAIEKRKATVTFTDNAPDSPQNVRVSGDGINSARVPPGSLNRRR